MTDGRFHPGVRARRGSSDGETRTADRFEAGPKAFRYAVALTRGENHGESRWKDVFADSGGENAAFQLVSILDEQLSEDLVISRDIQSRRIDTERSVSRDGMRVCCVVWLGKRDVRVVERLQLRHDGSDPCSPLFKRHRSSDKFGHAVEQVAGIDLRFNVEERGWSRGPTSRYRRWVVCRRRSRRNDGKAFGRRVEVRICR